jgi:inositol transport system substrate-binding protein
MIIGAIEAMAGADIDLSTKVTMGFDATDDAKAYMAEGKLSATIDQFPGKQAGMAMQALYDMVKSKKKPAKAVVYITPMPITE